MVARAAVLVLILLLAGCESSKGCGTRYGDPADCEPAETEDSSGDEPVADEEEEAPGIGTYADPAAEAAEAANAAADAANASADAALAAATCVLNVKRSSIPGAGTNR